MFCATLHPYQEEGVERAVARKTLLLAYDMGTGKTPMAIAALEDLMGQGLVRTALIIAPASLKWQWASRIAQFADVGARTVTLRGTQITVPDEQYCVVLGGGPAERANQYRQIARHRPDYVIAGYETATSDWKALRRIEADAVVLDEAQMIKNAGAARSKKVKRIDAEYRIALTGTPMDNGKPEEIFSVMQWVDPTVFGRYDLFDAAYVIRNQYKRAVAYRNLELMHRTLAPAMVRKTLADPAVARHMPAVVSERIMIELDPPARALYERIEDDLERALEDAREAGAGVVDVEALYAGGAQHTSPALGALASRMTAARLLLDHPELLRISAAKYRTTKSQGSAYAASLARAGLLDELTVSAKLTAASDYAHEVLSRPQAKLIVFTVYREMLPLLAKALGQYGPVFYHGELDPAARAAAVEKFTQSAGCRIFLSTDAGGTGLDLPAASHVLNYDLPGGVGPWQQRCTRHTRANSPHERVYTADLVVAGTIEEHHAARLAGARAVALAGVDNEHGAGAHTRASLSAHLTDARKQRAKDARARAGVHP